MESYALSAPPFGHCTYAYTPHALPKHPDISDLGHALSPYDRFSHLHDFRA
jgi:hypothetical protein